MFKKYLALLLLFVLVSAQDGEEEVAVEADADEGFGDEGDEAADGQDAEEGDDEEEAAEGGEEEAETTDEAGTDEAAAEPAEAKEAAPAVRTLEQDKEEEDLYILLIGISSILCTVWWLVWGWFVYIPTNAQDSTMCVNSDCVTSIVPIAWFWNSFGHTTLGWTALNYFWIWLFHLLISVPEMIFWAMVMAGLKLENNLAEWLFNMWSSYVGLYGGWAFYAFNIIWPSIQLGTSSGINQPGYLNAAIHLSMFLISWLFNGIVHTLGFPAVNRKYERELGHQPYIIPGAGEAPKEEAAATEEAVVEEAAEETAEEAEDAAEDATEDAEEAVDDAADEADDAFNTAPNESNSNDW